MKLRRNEKQSFLIVGLLAYITGVLLFALSKWVRVTTAVGEQHHPVELWVRYAHTLVTYLVVMAFGYLLSVHVIPGLRSKVRKKVLSGLGNCFFFFTLTFTAVAILYGSEGTWTTSVSWIHSIVGLSCPLFIFAHSLRRKNKLSRRKSNDIPLKPKATSTKLPLLLLLLFFGSIARGDEPLFGYVYTTDLLPQGKWELEQWITDREAQAHGYFHHLDMSTEVEYGVTNNFQVALYANYMYAIENGNSVRGLTEGIELPYDQDPTKPYVAGRFDGFSLELMYRVLSPYVDPIGLSFYVEPEIGYYESGIELRVIAQKNFDDDQLVLAANFWTEFESEAGSNLVVPGSDDVPTGGFSPATYAELDIGASYRFAPHWSAGLEFRNHNEYGGYTLSQAAQDHSAFFFGPNIHYAAESWFCTFSALAQLGAWTYTNDQQAELHNGLLYGDEHTTWDGLRFKLGFPF